MAKKKELSFDFPKPIDTDFLVGHDDGKRSFLNAWNNRDNYTMHPVWLMSGPKGIGKATLAYSFARKIFSDLSGKPESDVAEQMSVGGIGDLFTVDLEHNVVPKTTISIETIRAMIEKMQMSSMGETWRVVVIDSIDELSRGTENTLLKTLEEPPAKTIFFLIAHSLDAVLPTIRSRSHIEKLRPLSSIELREISSRLLPDKELSDDIIKTSGGSFGRIANLIATGADNLFRDAKDLLSDKSANASDYLVFSKRVASHPENMTIFLDVAASLGLAELYPTIQSDIERMDCLHLDPELVAFKILEDIKKCV
jgi:DNA polymerase-3 subunit delta'